MSPGMVVASSLLFELVVWPVLGLSSQWSQMQASVGAFGRISAWLKLAENKKTDASNTKHEELAQGICNQDQGNTQKGAHKENEIVILRLQQVTVTDEDSGRTILDQITLNLVPGELVAVVGASGAGKSTLCQVCAGLIEPINGSVLLGDKHVAEYVEMDNQSRLTYMPQRPTFSQERLKTIFV